MLVYILLSAAICALVMAAIGVGMFFGRPAPKGSCGGLAALGMKKNCLVCAGRKEDCPRRSASQ